jgi:hypothetical protein
MQRVYAHTDSRRGAIVVVTAFLLITLLAFAALAIDAGYMYMTRVQLQRTADAAALAAASQVNLRGNEAEMTHAAEQAAIEFAKKNPAAGDGVLLNPKADVELGNFHKIRRVFEPGFVPFNAVRVTARKTESSENGPLPLFLMGILGKDTADVWASATVLLKLDCNTLGIRATEVHIAADTVMSNMCVYGREYVRVSAGAEALSTSYISALDDRNIRFASGVPDGFQIGEDDMYPEGALNVAALIDGLENGSLLPTEVDPLNVTDLLPSVEDDAYVYDEDGSVEIPASELPPDVGLDPTVTVIVVEGNDFDLNLARSGTAYIFNENVVFSGGDVTVEGASFAVRGNAHFARGTVLRNGGLGAEGAPAIPILATGTIHFGSYAGLENGMLIAGEDVYFASNAGIFQGAIEAGGRVHAAASLTGLNDGFTLPAYNNIEVELVMVE